MKEKISFLNMFADYEPPEALKGVLSQAELVAADIDPDSRKVSVSIYSPTYIRQSDIDRVCREIVELYDLHEVRVDTTFPADQIANIETEELLSLFVAENSMTRGSLAGAQWNWDGTTLVVGLKANGKGLLQECVPGVTRKLQGSAQRVPVATGSSVILTAVVKDPDGTVTEDGINRAMKEASGEVFCECVHTDQCRGRP